MARAVTIGNGTILVGLDHRGQVRDLYHPFVGHSNHVSGASGSHVHRIGVYVDGELSWLDDDGWQVNIGCDASTLASTMHAVHDSLGITLSSCDIVHNERNVFIREFIVGNESAHARTVKLFLSQQFRISESRRGDTGFFDPRVNALIHYKGHTNILVNAFAGSEQFSEYNIGLFGIEGKEGTYWDAVDGKLECNPIEHGSVDSILALTFSLEPQTQQVAHYWIACGTSINEAHDLNTYILKETPKRLLSSTKNYWRAWIEKEGNDLSPLSDTLRTLYNRSLTTIRVHTDNNGAIIASSDTDILHHGRDTYGYVWPRDGAIIAHALDVTGYGDVAKRFFRFMTDCIERGGYLMHKYRSDATLGSSWHPWIIDGKPEFPIQEDETALVVYMLYEHYERERDLEFIESLYNPFIEPAAEFMAEFIESRLGLPSNSFDLWEEKFGISTYTASAVYGALLAASQFATLLGKTESSRTYTAVAQRVKEGILEHLYDERAGYFIKLIRAHESGDDTYDTTLDMSSFFGPLYFGVIPPNDKRLTRMYTAIEERLRVHGPSAGYMRYEGDNYYKMHDADSPNSWVIATLWVAQYHIMKATNEAELKEACDILEWTASHATPSGVLAEQMHPRTRVHLSTAPLVWSHAEFVLTCNAYLQKLRTFTD